MEEKSDKKAKKADSSLKEKKPFNLLEETITIDCRPYYGSDKKEKLDLK